jgi:trimeric autotransporter adhesin
MKKYLLYFLSCSYFSFAQSTVIQNNSTSVTITPNSITSQHPASGTNVAVGADALKFNQILPTGTTLGGIQNTAIGYQALYNNTSSDNNTALGYQALFSNTTGRTNLGLGPGALFTNSTGDYNTAVGEGALFYNNSSLRNSIKKGKTSIFGF